MGGSNIYGPPEARGGKYVADHVFNPGVVDSQLGTAVILKALMQLDSSINLGGAATNGSADHAGTHEPDDELSESVLWLQGSLNKLGANPRLAEDGKNGPKTMGAVSQFQRENGLPDTGLADPATIAAIGQKLSAPPAKGQENGQAGGQLSGPAIGQLSGPAGGQFSGPAGGQTSGDLIVAIKQLLDGLRRSNTNASDACKRSHKHPAASGEHPAKAQHQRRSCLSNADFDRAAAGSGCSAAEDP
jgi:peptidoglycan hydrolase-like protein with peptidoglycan-binding domain